MFSRVCKTAIFTNKNAKLLQVRKKRLACIYIDANGLHEINNARGHLAGDQMLRFIADTLKVSFGEEALYRIGGDEFVVFSEKERIVRAGKDHVRDK